jgi:hypothetical protein
MLNVLGRSYVFLCARSLWSALSRVLPTTARGATQGKGGIGRALCAQRAGRSIKVRTPQLLVLSFPLWDVRWVAQIVLIAVARASLHRLLVQ